MRIGIAHINAFSERGHAPTACNGLNASDIPRFGGLAAAHNLYRIRRLAFEVPYRPGAV